MAEEKRNAFELTLDDKEAIMNEIEYRIHQDAEYFAMDVDGADFLPEELQNLIDAGKFEEFQKHILDDPALMEATENYYFDTFDFSDTLEIFHEDCNTMLNEELHRILKTPMLEKYPIGGITELQNNDEFLLLGKDVGWKGESIVEKLELMHSEKSPEAELLDSFENGFFPRLVFKQEDKNIPALEIKRYTHDEPTGSSFLLLPYDATKEILDLPKFAGWKKPLELADKRFESMKMPNARFLPELSEHTERLEKVSAFNRKVKAGELQLSRPVKEYLLQFTDEFQGYPGREKIAPILRNNIRWCMESEEQSPDYEYYADAALAKLEEEKGKGYISKEDVRNLQKEVMRILPVPIEESMYVMRGFEDAAKSYLVPPLKQQVEAGIGKMVDDLKKQGFALPAIGKALQSASKEATEKLERESSAART